MTRPTNQNAEDTRRLRPLVRLFGILIDIAAQEVATRQDVETAEPLEVGAHLIAANSPTVRDVEEDPPVEEAA